MDSLKPIFMRKLNSKKFNITLLVLLIITLWSGSLMAQNRQFRQIYTADSSTLSETSQIVKSDDGFLWLAYTEGVARYNGYSLDIYRDDYGFNRHIERTDEGDILSYVPEHKPFTITRYNPIADKFEQVTTNLEHLTAYTSINGSDSSNNIVWYATNRGVICFDSNNDRWIYFNSFRTNNISAITCADDDKIIFISDDTIYIASYNLSNETLEVITTTHLKQNITPLSTIYDAKSQRVFIGTMNSGLMTYDIQSQNIKFQEFNRAPVRSIALYDNDYLLVGTDGMGLYTLNKYTQKIRSRYFNRNSSIYSISSNAIYGIYVDEKLRIYCSTFAHGVLVLDPNVLKYKLSRPTMLPNQPIDATVNCISEDDEQRVWYATNDGVYTQDLGKYSWIKCTNSNNLDKGNSVILELCPTEKYIYVANYGGGLQRINRSQKLIENIKFQEPDSNPKLLISLDKDDDGKIWMGGINTRIQCYNPKTNTIEKFGSKTSITSIKYIGNDILLYISSLRPYTINTKTKDIKEVVIDEEFLKQFDYEPSFNGIKQWRDIIYFTTNNYGLISYNTTTKKFRSFQSLTGDLYCNTFSTEIDESGNVWLSTSNGVICIDPVKNLIQKLQNIQPSNNISFVKRASTTLSNGDIGFGTLNGVLRITPQFITPTEPLAEPIITDFRVFYNSVHQSEEIEELSKPLNELETIELNNQQNTFSFHFDHIDFSRLEKPLFSWMLEGVDTRWSPISTKSSAEYTNISPGSYKFTLRAYGSLSSKEFTTKVIEVIVHPAWYLSTLMIIVYSALLLCAAFLAIYLYNKRLEQRQSEERINFFITTSHDIRTPITLIKAPLENLNQDPSLSASSRYMVSLITKNVDRIYNMINQLLDYEKFESNEEEIEKHEISLNDYLRKVVDNFWELALSRHINLKLELQEPNIIIYENQEYIDKIMDNLLSNAIKYSKESGEVIITTRHNQYEWQIDVKDFGIGIPQNQQSRLFKQFYRADNAINSKQIGSGVGLLFVDRLLREMGGEISFVSRENQFTTFTIKLPRNNNPELLQSTLEEEIEPTFDQSDNTVQEADNQKSTILIVDDNNDILEYLTHSFSAIYKVCSADSVENAMQIIMHSDINLIITDIMMPEVDGFEFCERLKSQKHTSHIPIVLLSALSKREDILKGLQYGVDDYIVKPFELEELKSRIENIIKSRKALSQYYSSTQTAVETEETPQEDGANTMQYFNEMDNLFLEQIQEIIEQNISNNDFSINHLCKALCMSRSVFYNRLKNLTNLTPSDLIRKARMDYAMKQLQSHKYSIQEVSDMVGFSDAKYFSKVFHKYFGSLPSKFMQDKTK